MTDSTGGQAASAQQVGVLEVDATITNPLLFTATMYTVNIDVNGQRFPGRWDRNVSSFCPGQYRVTVSFASIFGDWASATAHVEIYAGHATVLQYSPGMFMGIDTKLTLKGCFPLPPQP